MPKLLRTALALALFAGAPAARADRTYLSGGSVIEGRSTRQGEKVIIEVESGTIAIPAESVVRIEKSESTVSRFEARYTALRPTDVKARLVLADYCRDHDMRAREEQLLREVLLLDADNSAARTRLGYVKGPSGWVTHDDAMREKGLVQHEGRWVTEAELLEENRLGAERLAAEARRDDAAEAQARRRILDQERAELELERARMEARRARSTYYPVYSSFYSPLYPVRVPSVRFEDCADGRGCARAGRPSPEPPPFDSTSLSVVKVPYRHSR